MNALAFFCRAAGLAAQWRRFARTGYSIPPDTAKETTRRLSLFGAAGLAAQGRRYARTGYSTPPDTAKETTRRLSLFGAAGRGRTDTVSLPLDFESSASANSTTAAFNVIII